MQENILLVAEQYLTHPVLAKLGLGPSSAIPPSKVSQIDSYTLIIFDCRLANPEELASKHELFLRSVTAGKPTLLLCPSRAHLQAINSQLGACPTEPSAAVLFASSINPAGIRNTEISSLSYNIPVSDTEHESARSRAADQADINEQSRSSCNCRGGQIGETFVDGQSVDRFVGRLARYVESGAVIEPEAGPIPTGLKYFRNTFHISAPFTYCQGGACNNTSGSIDLTWTVWGFLDQRRDGNSQYLVVESNYTLYPGQLRSNGETDRGFGNAFVYSGITPPLSPYKHQPVDGNNSWSGEVKIDISYKDPFNAYQIYTYENTVNQTINSWSVKGTSSGSKLGSQWYMNSPCDGSNIPGAWQNAFDFWGHVKDLPGSTTGSLGAYEISSWTTNNLLKGYQPIGGDYGWEGVRFWGDPCTPGVCWQIHAGWNWFYWNPGFSVDFTPINPEAPMTKK